MPVPTSINDLSTTASANYPSGTDSPATLDDVQRAHASFIAELRDGRLPRDGSLAMTAVLNLYSGIKFPALQVPVADANTLDDYEEGSWTPVDASGAGLSFTGASGQYTKIGRQVTVLFALAYPATGSTSASSIGGLPFAPAASHAGAIWPYGIGSIVAGLLGVGTTVVTPYNTEAGANLTNTQLASRLVRGSLTYFV